MILIRIARVEDVSLGKFGQIRPTGVWLLFIISCSGLLINFVFTEGGVIISKLIWPFYMQWCEMLEWCLCMYDSGIISA